MLFAPATKRNIKAIHTCLKELRQHVDDIHRVIYVDGNGKSYQTRLATAEDDAKEAKRIALSRTNAMWTVMTFALLAVGGIIGYQMYRIDEICQSLYNALSKSTCLF